MQRLELTMKATKRSWACVDREANHNGKEMRGEDAATESPSVVAKLRLKLKRHAAVNYGGRLKFSVNLLVSGTMDSVLSLVGPVSG
ncbi:hypothetical protein ElyMa_006848600 [Elysia marginata]|uniref:Arrestin-like N-terminal domain-containing protein n=1 Tax=Elysia marginata TaxID=1093978 RepID=A0AAV4J9V8_9GAST|nr:hypothetical protein ElyMa_006848600 [Elysia marginata]